MAPAIPSVCPNGWDAILREALDQLLDLSLKQQRRISISQVKAKFAELRIYLTVEGEPSRLYFDIVGGVDGVASGHLDKAGEDSVSALAYRIVEHAARQSRAACQICGAPGRVRRRAWWAVLCDEHARHLKGGLAQVAA